MESISVQSVIPEAIVCYKNQAEAPVSPGKLKARNFQFCAGACLAYVGLKTKFGLNRALEFATSNCNSSDSALILEAFKELGWDANLAKKMIARNDNYSQTIRRMGVLNDFTSLLSLQ